MNLDAMETTCLRAHGWEELVWNTGDMDPEPCSLRGCRVLPGEGVKGSQLGTVGWVLVQALLHGSVTLSGALGLSFPFTGGWLSETTQTRQSLCSHCYPLPYLKPGPRLGVPESLRRPPPAAGQTHPLGPLRTHTFYWFYSVFQGKPP